MKNSLGKISVIDRSALSGEHYFRSLLEAAHSRGMLTVSDIERLQFECLNLLADKTESYNFGGSSSIPEEKAQSIMASNLFTIGLQLKAYRSPDDAAEALRGAKVTDLYQKGRKRVSTMIMAAKAVYRQLLGQLAVIDNVFYNDTLGSGIQVFFKRYCADYAAHEIPLGGDYRVYNRMARFGGIEYFSMYLNAIVYENKLCSYFEADVLHRLLGAYDAGYRELLFNIYGFVLTAALGCVISGTDIYGLDAAEAGTRHLVRYFSEMPKNEISGAVQKSGAELVRRLQCTDGLAGYIQNSLPLITRKIVSAARTDTLDRVFASYTFSGNRPEPGFSFGDSLNDDDEAAFAV